MGHGNTFLVDELCRAPMAMDLLDAPAALERIPSINQSRESMALRLHSASKSDLEAVIS